LNVSSLHEKPVDVSDVSSLSEKPDSSFLFALYALRALIHLSMSRR
jgi:acyl-CoA-binding protein